MMIGPAQLIIVVIVLGVPIAVIAAIVAMATNKRSKAKKKHCDDNSQGDGRHCETLHLRD